MERENQDCSSQCQWQYQGFAPVESREGEGIEMGQVYLSARLGPELEIILYHGNVFASHISKHFANFNELNLAMPSEVHINPSLCMEKRQCRRCNLLKT